MIDEENPVVQRLVENGYEIALHAYLRDDVLRVSVVARHSETGDLLQGWSWNGTQADALRDLAERAGWD